MSYAEQGALYSDISQRQRMTMCAREQGYIYTADGRADIAALGRGVVAGDPQDIDAVIAAVCTGPNWDSISEDQALLSATQSVWPTVAAARYPQSAS